MSLTTVDADINERLMTRALGNGRLLRMLIRRMKAISCRNRNSAEKRAHEITGRLWHYRRLRRRCSWMLTRQVVGHLVYELGYLDIGRLRRRWGREWDGGGARVVMVVMELLMRLIYMIECVCSRWWCWCCCCCRVEEDLISRVCLIAGGLVHYYWLVCCWCRCRRCWCCIDELSVIVLVVLYSYLVVNVGWRRRRRRLFARWYR